MFADSDEVDEGDMLFACCCNNCCAVVAFNCEIGDGEAWYCFGLLTFVLDFANSSLIGWGKSGSKRTLWRSSLAASALALVENVTKPTGEELLPSLLVTFSSEPS